MKSILIVGAQGAMGQWFTKHFEAQNLEVMGIDKGDVPQDYIKDYDAVLVSVPLRDSVSILESLVPLMGEDQLLCDVSGLKEEQVRAMSSTSGEYLGMHPLYGPRTPNCAGQTIIYCGSPKEKGSEILSTFTDAHLLSMSGEEHDRGMALVQVLNHHNTAVMGECIRSLGMDLETLTAISTPLMQVKTDVISRLFSNNPELFADMWECNPYAQEALDTYVRVAEKFADASRETYLALFRENSQFYAPISKEAKTRSDAVLSTYAKKPKNV